MNEFQKDDAVIHPDFGEGTVVHDTGQVVIVQFRHGIESCDCESLRKELTVVQSLECSAWASPLELTARVQAAIIHSINQRWSCFTRSRIALLPHQLWVCRKVNEEWPTRWLVADDVGLGKTIEAGLVLTPLLTSGKVRRLLIICPAHLVEQWQYRMRTMFDIRMMPYRGDMDNERVDFFDTFDQIIISLQTIRNDKHERYNRLFESRPWDMLFVDEAHHLNADKDSGWTQGYRLVERLMREQKVTSAVFFTGTPHRGKDFGFLSLLKLLRQDLFDPRGDIRAQLYHIHDVMIRNNKSCVTDLEGNRLFQPPDVRAETYSYTEQEERFYAMMTEFILQGKAYASRLSAHRGRMVNLVLTAMQKLASSSIAAITKAIEKRLDRLRQGVKGHSKYIDYTLDEDESPDENIVTEVLMFLTQNEEEHLVELLDAAREVETETKIERLLEVVEEQFPDESVLFFTEYKATQALVMSSLIKIYGDDCVTFINGDGYVEGVETLAGARKTIRNKREKASEEFCSGERRFLVSTEAAGEGVDLHENCAALIHVDLPWNPMRLHQRVGRLNRYGQKRKVRVVSLRNPDTVESRLWDILNEKLQRIMLAFNAVMDDPEDLLQLVLGMASPKMFEGVFSEATTITGADRRHLKDWFDAQTRTFGDMSAIELAKAIMGNCTRFDFEGDAPEIPKADIPDINPFFLNMLRLNGRRPTEDADGMSFITPDVWLTMRSTLRSRYENLLFHRDVPERQMATRMMGAGHQAFDTSVSQALQYSARITVLSVQDLPYPLTVFLIQDQVTANSAGHTYLVAFEIIGDQTKNWRVLYDWEILKRLNVMRLQTEPVGIEDTTRACKVVLKASEHMTDILPNLGFKMSKPKAFLYGLFVSV